MAEPEEIPGETLMEKIYSHRSSDSSGSSGDEKTSKKADDAVKPASPEAVKHKVEEEHKPAAKDSVKSNKFRIFGREKPVHKVLGGGKRTLSLSLLIFLSLCFDICIVESFLLFWLIGKDRR